MPPPGGDYTKVWVLAVGCSQRPQLVVQRLHLVGWVNAKAEDVTAGTVGALHAQSAAEFCVFELHVFDLNPGDGYVEVFGKQGMPHEPYIGEKHHAEISGVRAQIPHPGHLVCDRFLRQRQ